MSFYEILMSLIQSFVRSACVGSSVASPFGQGIYVAGYMEVARDAMKQMREIAHKSVGKNGFTALQIREMNSEFAEFEELMTNYNYITYRTNMMNLIRAAEWTTPCNSNKFSPISSNGLDLDSVVGIMDGLGYAIGQNWEWAGTSETMFIELF